MSPRFRGRDAAACLSVVSPGVFALGLGLMAAAGCSETVVDAVVLRPVAEPPVDGGAPVDAPMDTAASDDAPSASDAPPAEADGGADAADGLDAGPPPPRSCAEIRAARPEAADGTYTIDPDGPGGQPPFSVFCDMASRGGGWTRLVNEDFASPPMGFSYTTITTCGAFGRILGGHRQLSNDTVTATFDLRGVPHTELRVRFDFIVIDSWDSELAFAELDGRRIWSVRCAEGRPETCNQTADQCGWDGMARRDGKVPVDVTVPHEGREAKLTFGAVLDQAAVDESWGLDNLSLWVR